MYAVVSATPSRGEIGLVFSPFVDTHIDLYVRIHLTLTAGGVEPHFICTSLICACPQKLHVQLSTV